MDQQSAKLTILQAKTPVPSQTGTKAGSAKKWTELGVNEQAKKLWKIEICEKFLQGGRHSHLEIKRSRSPRKV